MVFFDLPEGSWRIVFLIKTRSGISDHHLAHCDKLNPMTTKLYIEEVYQAQYDHFKEYFGNTFMGFFSDEPAFANNTQRWSLITKLGEELVHYPWRENVLDRLKMKFKEDAIKFLPGLWFDIDGVTDKIRLEYMNIITDEYKKNYCDQLADWCHEHGVMYIGHIVEDNNAHACTEGSAGHFFRAMDRQDMSGVDVVLHQIVPGLTETSNAGQVCYKSMDNDFFQYYLAKLGSSFAHIDPLKKGRAMCEIFGAYGWAEGSRIMKYLIDHMLVRGINYYVPHGFSDKPNDPDCPPNFYAWGKNPQYKYFKILMDYMNRMCHLLNGGKHISTCALLYDAEARWTTQNFLPLEKCAKVLYDNLFDYDITPIDYLDKFDADGCINGEKYNCLLVPYYDTITEETVKKLKNTGVRVIMLSENDVETGFENVKLPDLIKYMRDSKYEDVTSDYEGIYLRYYHYVRDNTHFYMFNNEDAHNTIKANVTLSAFGGGKYAEYDALENKCVVKESSLPTVSIELAPYNATVLICADTAFDNIEKFKDTKITEEKVLTPVFDISLKRETEDEYSYFKTTQELFNITGREGLVHFSGSIKYECLFDLKSEGNYILDLGYVGEIAQLSVNGKYIGARVVPDYSFDITDAVKIGENKIELIVTNHKGFEERDTYSKYLLFEPSGLLGPVKIKKYI